MLKTGHTNFWSNSVQIFAIENNAIYVKGKLNYLTAEVSNFY
jgi:hypothetical protein